MPNVVRFVLDSARDLHVPGAGQFSDGVLDVDANNIAAVKRVRYLIQPYRAVELGIVASTTPPPVLPAAPGSVTPTPDPYPQYPTLDEIVASPQVRATFVSVLVYADSAYPPRPSGVPGGRIKYIGPVQPTTWLSGDEWVNNS